MVAGAFALFLIPFIALGETVGIRLLALSTLPMLAAGWLLGFTGNFLTLFKRSQKELEESEQRYRALFENLPVALGVTDVRGRLIAYNPAMLRPGGYSMEDIAAVESVSDLYFDPADRAIVLSGLAEKGEVRDVEIRFKRKDGSPYLGRLTVIPVDIAGEKRRLAIVDDITEEVKAREKLERSERRFRSLIENSQDVVALIDEGGNLLEESIGVLTVLGFTPDELVGADMISMVHPEDWERAAALFVEVVMEPGTIRTAQVRTQRKDGAWIWVEATGKNMLADPDVKAIVVNFRDVTHLIQANQDLRRRAEQLETLYRLSQSLNEQQDLQALLYQIADIAAGMFEANGGAIYLYDPVEGNLVSVVSTADFIPIGTRLALGEGLAGRVFEARKALIVDDYSIWEGRADSFTELRFRAVAEAPLSYAGVVLGVLAVYQVGESGRKYNEDDLHLLSLFASQAAGAVHNARLYESLERSNIALSRAYDHTLEGWARALDLRDSRTEGHTKRVTEMTLRLARSLGIEGEELDHIRRGALLHDIGKMSIPDHILLKDGPLDPAEWEVMKLHPVYAMEFIRPVAFLEPALDIPYCHHECWDGSGYPRGLKGEEIPIAARIFSVVDAWDALRSDRPYREAWSDEEVLRQLRADSGGRFDPSIVQVFLALLEQRAAS